MNGIAKFLAALVFAVLPRLALAQTAPQTPVTSEHLQLTAGKSIIYDTDAAVSNILLGNPEIADVVVLRPNQLYLLGKSLGTTNVQLMGAEGQIFAILDLVVGSDLKEADSALSAAFPDARIDLFSVNGRIRIAGELPDKDAVERAVEIAQNFSDQPVINTLTISNPPQVYLQVQVIEVSRSVSQQLASSLSNTSVSFDAGGAASLLTGGSASATIDTAVRNGLARYLATPTLTAQSGETASFLAGGEAPIPMPDSEGGNSIQYKEFGVRLTFSPKVLAGGVITLSLEPEVSQIDPNHVYTQNGIDVPGFVTRRANTTVTLKDGESFAIAGLLQSNKTRDIQRFPWLGNLPVIGALFRDTGMKNEQTDLLIVVTPSFTRPTAAGDQIVTPFQGRDGAEGFDLFGQGETEVSTYRLKDAVIGKGTSGRSGHILTIGGAGAVQGN